MSENAAAKPLAGALHLPTVIAIALVAYALTNIAHEGVGHGGMCVAVGGEPITLNAVYFDCSREGVTNAGSRWISAAAASFGGASALAWMAQLLRNRERFPRTAELAADIPRSWPWLAAGALTAAFFIGILGPGIVLTPGR